MDPRLWTCFAVLLLCSQVVVAVPLADVDIQLATITPNTSSPTPVFSLIPPPCHTTRFTHRPPETVASGVRVQRWLLMRRRKLEFFVRWVVGSLLPEVRPTRADFLYLRSLEDPVFMSAHELPLTNPAVSPQPTDHMFATLKASNVNEILGSLEAELEKAPNHERKRIAEDLHQLFKRNLDNEQSINSQD